jgi:hypothetical protein
MCAAKCNISMTAGDFLIKFCLGELKIIVHVLGMFNITFGCIPLRGIYFFILTLRLGI